MHTNRTGTVERIASIDVFLRAVRAHLNVLRKSCIRSQSPLCRTRAHRNPLVYLRAIIDDQSPPRPGAASDTRG